MKNNTDAYYLDRDVSWLYFNHRILQEATKETVPLMERLQFLGIYSSNLDEFYRVRVATITRIANARESYARRESRRAKDLLARITNLNAQYAAEYTTAVNQVIRKLWDAGIHLLKIGDLDDEQMHVVRCTFRRNILGYISPIMADHLTEFTRENDERIYLAVKLTRLSGDVEYAVIKLPVEHCGRFIQLPDRDGAKCLMYIDDVVRHGLPLIFAGLGFTKCEGWSFKFTRDAEMDIDSDSSMGAIQKIAQGIKSRKKGQALRVVYDAEMPADVLNMVMSKLKLNKIDTLIAGGRYPNHRDFMSFPTLGRSDLKYPAWPSVVPPELKGPRGLLELIQEKDRFVHVPYQTFDYVIRVLQEAAIHPQVKSIKITLYRVASQSRIVEALINAARNGKKVTAVVELMARFDESDNIHWSKKLKEAGVYVIFGVEGLKVHSKIAHINMRGSKSIAIVGTGNFHEGNAKTYTDYFMMTADKRITREVDRVFDFIHRPYRPVEFKHLLVSPNSMREPFLKLIDKEIANHRKGLPAFIKIKINHVTDREMVDKLYEASAAGVPVEMSVRGCCSLVTTENPDAGHLDADGIIDRYLEHSRLFWFCNGGKNSIFLGSADWMPRNLNQRVEVITSVYDPDVRADVMAAIDAALSDTTNGRIVDGTGRNLPWTLRTMPDARQEVTDQPLRSQQWLYNHYVQLNKTQRNEHN